MLRNPELVILKGIAENIGRNCEKLPDDPLTGFMAMVGELYNHELMVVGRAVNGWAKGVIPRMLNDPDNREEFVQGVFESVTTGANGELCPMRWVSQCWGNYEYDYNTRKSAFWRVIRSTVKKLAIADVEKEEWPSYLIWSNLYKIAPANGGNPSNTLCDLQFSGCKSLLIHEINTFIPKRLLCLTGGWASPFLEGHFPGIKPMNGYDYVEANETINLAGEGAIKVVVAAHPQGKTEDVWVDEVADAFN